MEKLIVIKIGGNIIDDETALSLFLESFAKISCPKILVHGGGKLATRLAEALGIQQQVIDGRRITDAETLKVVTMLYAGYINKNIVAKLQAYGCNAVGLCGADGNLVLAHKRQGADIDYGFAGDIDRVNAAFASSLLQQDRTPVLSAITHDAKGTLLNTNADTIAQETAKALAKFYKVSLIYCFEKKGVLQDAANENSVIPIVTKKSFEELKTAGVVNAGMVPKLKNALDAVGAGVQQVIIGHAAELEQLIIQKAGTSIVHD